MTEAQVFVCGWSYYDLAVNNPKCPLRWPINALQQYGACSCAAAAISGITADMLRDMFISAMEKAYAIKGSSTEQAYVITAIRVQKSKNWPQSTWVALIGAAISHT